ncbi:acetyl-CoA carboxylase biotin carboxyl carrier protein [Methylovirgula sp. 4M-Z18]|uniref:acetyl-CoA carboxylase biotin carboxyl carrier protein n=1 Tax=Methylovirgula sp. 4M-Z18 TaxID=2293567 RepID=UPI000E2F0729|nr:acetyl-CoA carboxylase biotin carboxyl carrier protein [Methylovirgula sp. 4M-Z18]RFB80572.1 acetyl-CoA carboxylase biotin carboxyl carrier protein [Methylovirgula sp. 4M-Z18]
MKKPAKTPSAPRAVSDKSIDANLVREIADLLTDTDLTEIEVEKGDLRIRVSRAVAAVATAAPMAIQHHVAPAPQAAPAPAQPAAPPVPAAENPGTVKSPMVGTAYRRTNPQAKPFVEIGSVVKAGDKILLVEAMKTFNEIVAPRAGTITAIMVEDGQPVEYGQPLLVIE